MKRAGFTMIELIFVIVILGILAAVAVPKLAATRTDAEISKGATEIGTALSDFGTHFTAQGAFDAIVNNMTNVTFDGNTTGGAGTIDYQTGSTPADCIMFVLTVDGNITVSNSTAANTTALCVGIQGAVSDLYLTHQYGGATVTY